MANMKVGKVDQVDDSQMGHHPKVIVDEHPSRCVPFSFLFDQKILILSLLIRYYHGAITLTFKPWPQGPKTRGGRGSAQWPPIFLKKKP